MTEQQVGVSPTPADAPPTRRPPEARPQGGESQQAAPSQPERPSLAEYNETNPEGEVRVRTLKGHQVVSTSNPDLPQFGSEGIAVTQEQADALVEEFPDFVYVDENEEG